MDLSRTSARGALAGLALVFVMSAAASAGLRPNPANDPRLLSKPIEGFDYDYGRRCSDGVPRGTKALERWLDRNVRGETWGIKRCERWGPNSYSLHAEGRAIDWHLDARHPKERAAAYRLIDTLLMTDRRGQQAALARRMGVQGIIFDCRSWFGSGGRLGKYSYCYRDNGKRKKGLDPTAAHRDHVHIEINKPGARLRTSFWRSPLARPYR